MNESKRPALVIRNFIFWILGSFAIGIGMGLAGIGLFSATQAISQIRSENSWILFLLPIGGVFIVFIYKLAKLHPDPGLGVVVEGLQSGKTIPLRLAPLVFLADTISLFVGASVGRIGTSFQMGGGIGDFFAKLLKLNDNNKKILIMTCISGTFTGLFGTPAAGTLFPIEMSLVGGFQFSALLPCLISSYTAFGIRKLLDIPGLSFQIISLPDISIQSVLLVALLGTLVGLIAMLYLFFIKKLKVFGEKILPNPYVKALVFGGILLLLSILFKDQVYNGLGGNIIGEAFAASVFLPAFLIKILFTGVSLTAGYRGGQIFPALFSGATFGAGFGIITGFYPSFSAGIGLAAIFCGVTNCPLTAILLSAELFGGQGFIFFVIAIILSYFSSGYFSVFPGQKFTHSKYRIGS